MGDGRPGVGQPSDVVVREPDAVGPDEARVQEPELREARDDGLPPAFRGVDDLHLGLGEVRVDPDPVLAREARAPREEVVGALPRDRGRDVHPDAPTGGAVPAAHPGLGEAEEPIRRRRLDVLDGRAEVRRQEVEEPGHGPEEDHVRDRGREDGPQPHVGIRADHGLDPFVGGGRNRHEQIVGGRAAGLEHLHGVERRRQVLLLERAVRVQRRAVRQEVLERPPVGQPLQEGVVGVRVRVHESREDEAARGVEHPRVGRRGEVRPDRANPVAVDQHIGRRESVPGPGQHLTSANQHGHGIPSSRSRPMVSRRPSGGATRKPDSSGTDSRSGHRVRGPTGGGGLTVRPGGRTLM